MTRDALIARLRELIESPLPAPGKGQTALRHKGLMEVGRENLSLARLAEAHWDAVAILDEAGRIAERGAIYGVWASEIPGAEVELLPTSDGFSMTGAKMFCSGAGIVDRALLTVSGKRLVEIDLREQEGAVEFDDSAWKTSAFAETKTVKAIFRGAHVCACGVVGEADWYIARPGFWHGACGPAACWAGGAAGLVDWALQQKRRDPHTLAHLGAMTSSVWMFRSLLDQAGREIDESPGDAREARARALRLRHLIEEGCTDVLRRFARVYGPHPLAMDEEMSSRYIELDLYLRQSHAERDLEELGELLLLPGHDTVEK